MPVIYLLTKQVQTMILRQLLEEKRETIFKIASKRGAYNIRIFGSVARDDETKDSDINFLVD